MTIALNKFGTTLLSRGLGREAFAAFQSTLQAIPENEPLTIDFAGVLIFSPSWGDEFLTPLLDRLGERLILKKSDNQSVVATIEILEQTSGNKFRTER